MQTFIPYADIHKSAQCLDRQRLGKQRVETLQILNALTGRSKGWVNHPATKMWRGHELALVEYGVAVCQEWQARGYNDSCEEKIRMIGQQLAVNSDNCSFPEWWGDDRVHDSHKSQLMRKHPDWYHLFGWLVPNDLPYFWPVQ